MRLKNSNIKTTQYSKDVRKALIDHDMSMLALSEKLGVKTQYIYDILSGARKGTRVRAGIEEILGVKYEHSCINQ